MSQQPPSESFSSCKHLSALVRKGGEEWRGGEGVGGDGVGGMEDEGARELKHMERIQS